MKELLINPQLISHLEITPPRKTEYKWLDKIESFTTLFGFKLGEYKEGWYLDGRYSKYRLNTEDFKNKVEINGEVWIMPSLTVFSAGKKIYSAHYEDLPTIKELIQIKFPNVIVL